LTHNKTKISNTLNGFFFSVFTTPSPLPELPSVTEKDNIVVTKEGVVNLLRQLIQGKAPGVDGFTKNYLTVDLDRTAEIFVCIFNHSRNTGIVPDDWETANVTPVFKQGNRTLASNYRPVSLTCICCKILEHVVLHHLNIQLENFIHESQHGFRRNFLCVTQLATVNHDILRHIDKGHFVDAVVLDFSKAFDVIDHHILVNKMIWLKINPCIIRWVSSFLTGRSQRAVIDGYLRI